MKVGQHSPEAEAALDRLCQTYLLPTYKNERRTVFYSESISRLNNLADNRRKRLLDSHSEIPELLLDMMIVGAFIAVFFPSFFFGAPNVKAQALMSALLTAMIAIVLYVTITLDHPFTGKGAISPEAFHHVISMMSTHPG